MTQYRWVCPHDWLFWKYGRNIPEAIRTLLWEIDDDTIQDSFQSEMEDDGYFEEEEDEEEEDEEEDEEE